MREDESMWLFGEVPPAFCDAAHRQEVEAFLAPRAQSHLGARQVLDDALESAKSCESSLQRNCAAISAFLAKY